MNPTRFCTHFITIIYFICFHSYVGGVLFKILSRSLLDFKLFSQPKEYPAQEMHFSFPAYAFQRLHLSFAKCIMTHHGCNSLKNPSYDKVIWKAADQGTGLVKFLVIAASIRSRKAAADVKMCYCCWISTVCKNNFQ